MTAPKHQDNQTIESVLRNYEFQIIAMDDDDTGHTQLEKALNAIEQINAEREREIEKAYGGCRNCYGKGYATVKSQIIGYGTDGDIGGYEGKYKQDTPAQMNYCDCERGKQLAALHAALHAALRGKDRNGHTNTL